MDPLDLSLGKAASHDLAQDVSLASEAEELIAAWNGGKGKYDDGETPPASHAEDDHSLHGQRTGTIDAGYIVQVRSGPACFKGALSADLAHVSGL